jgi:hypothetical protein
MDHRRAIGKQGPANNRVDAVGANDGTRCNSFAAVQCENGTLPLPQQRCHFTLAQDFNFLHRANPGGQGADEISAMNDPVRLTETALETIKAEAADNLSGQGIHYAEILWSVSLSVEILPNMQLAQGPDSVWTKLHSCPLIFELR